MLLLKKLRDYVKSELAAKDLLVDQPVSMRVRMDDHICERHRPRVYSSREASPWGVSASGKEATLECRGEETQNRSQS